MGHKGYLLTYLQEVVLGVLMWKNDCSVLRDDTAHHTVIAEDSKYTWYIYQVVPYPFYAQVTFFTHYNNSGPEHRYTSAPQ